MQDFADVENLPALLYRFGRNYAKSGNDSNAESVYNSIVSSYPDNDFAFEAQRELVHLYFRQDRKDDIEKGVAKLVQDFADVENLPALLYRIGRNYAKSGNDSNAEGVYNSIVSSYPDNDFAFKAQKELVYLYFSQDRKADVEKGIARLVSDFSSHPKTVWVIANIAGMYKNAKAYEMAEDVFQIVLENYPNSYCALESQEHMIYMLNEQNIDAGGAIDKLVSDFNDHSALPKALLDIAIRYEIAEKYSEARGVYQWLEQICPGSPYGCGVAGETLDYFEAEDYNKAIAAVDRVIWDFRSNVDTSRVVFAIGERYYRTALALQKEGSEEEIGQYYNKAKGIWQRIISNLPESDVTASAYYFCGACCRSMGKYGDASGYWKVLVNKWPNYKYSWSAQSLVGECYEKMKKSGLVSESEAILQIEDAYKGVIEKYPDCSLVKHACLKLGKLYLNEGRWEEAVIYFNLFLEDFPENELPIRVVSHLGKAYEKMGELDVAVQLYSAYLEVADPNSGSAKHLKERLAKLQDVK